MDRFIDNVISVAAIPPVNATPNAGVVSRLISGDLSIKDMVAGGKMVRFVRFCANELWYVTEEGFEFAVPVGDVGTATMLAEDKAMFFMRYIRKHIDMLKAAHKNKDEASVTQR